MRLINTNYSHLYVHTHHHNLQVCADLVCCLFLLQSPCQLFVYILQLSNLTGQHPHLLLCPLSLLAHLFHTLL